MTYYENISRITRADGLLSGEVRRAANFVKSRTDDAHGDSVAQSIGYRGGLVSALIHEEQFMPLAREAFGQEWFERGSYSFFSRTATVDQDEVQAFMVDPGSEPGEAEVEAWSVNAAGERVTEGTVGMGEAGRASALRRRMEAYPLGRSELIYEVEPGMPLGRELRWFPFEKPDDADDTRPYKRKDYPRGESQMQRRADTTEPLDWYFGDSPWGGPIAGPLALARLVRPAFRWLDIQGALSIVGGMEVQFVNGPLFLDKDYVVSGRIVGASSSPKTEVVWFESSVTDPLTGVEVARGLLMERYFPQSPRG